MIPRKLFLEEVSQQLRESKRTENIIFLNVAQTLYPSRLSKWWKAAVKSDPRIIKAISPEMLATLDKEHLAIVLEFSPEAIQNLQRLCQDHAAKIVLLSPGEWGRYNLDQVKALFSIHHLDKYIFDNISSYRDNADIEKWLVEHAATVRSYVILSYRHDEKRFGERYVHCRASLSEELPYQEANRLLGKPLQFEKSSSKLLLDAIKDNKPSVTHVEFNLENITPLKLGYGWNTETLMDNLFSSLAKNQHITHLILRDLYYDEFRVDDKISTEIVLKRIADLLLKSPMKLEYLNISHNSLNNFDKLLSVLDGHKRHIPHVCFNANPVHYAEQQSIAKWISTYPLPIKIDLDLSNSGWGRYTLDACFVDAVAQNKNIQLYIKENTFQSSHTLLNVKSMNQLIESGRIQLDPEFRNEPQAECRMQ